MKELLSEVQAGLQGEAAATPRTSRCRMPSPPWAWKSKGRGCVFPEPSEIREAPATELEPWSEVNLARNTMRKAGCRGCLNLELAGLWFQILS